MSWTKDDQKKLEEGLKEWGEIAKKAIKEKEERKKRMRWKKKK